MNNNNNNKIDRQRETADRQTDEQTDRRRQQFHVAPAMSALEVRTPPRWIFKNALLKNKKKLVTHVESHAGAASLLEIRRIALYKSDQQTNKQTNTSPVPMHGDAASDLSLKAAGS